MPDAIMAAPSAATGLLFLAIVLAGGWAIWQLINRARKR